MVCCVGVVVVVVGVAWGILETGAACVSLTICSESGGPESRRLPLVIESPSRVAAVVERDMAEQRRLEMQMKTQHLHNLFATRDLVRVPTAVQHLQWVVKLVER
ncbi:hypothetical protein GGS20DRAFT_583272 [Poronia punctata]|nr:hypothetical protein GGS20DRAFT_583272 [Poronia punctata]